MIEDHHYSVSPTTTGEKYLICRRCDTAFRIRGETIDEMSVHIMTLLGSFEWEPCEIPVGNTLYSASADTQGMPGGRGAVGSSAISQTSAKINQLNVSIDQLTDAIRNTTFQ